MVAARHEVVDQVGSDSVEPVVVGNQVVLTPELPGQALLLVLVECGLLEDPLHVAVEVGVDELHLRRPVLVVEGNGGLVLDGLAEVVDRHVVAEDLARALLPGDQRRAGERQEGGVG